MNTLAIFGVGLIGGSFALAMRRAGFTGRIIGVSSPSTIRRALELGVIDQELSARQAAETADLIYLALPIQPIIDILADLDRWARPDALITDVGSTKNAIVDQAARTMSRCQFLGGHPLAGREQRGVDAAEAHLFRGRLYVLTPRSAAELDSPAVRQFRKWIDEIGAVTMILGAAEHDRVVACTSHLPQLASTALASMLDQRSEGHSGVFGPGLIDSTRLALSSFDIWGDILTTNREAVQDALRSYIAALQEFSQVLEREPNHLRQYFERARRFADALRDRGV